MKFPFRLTTKKIQRFILGFTQKLACYCNENEKGIRMVLGKFEELPFTPKAM